MRILILGGTVFLGRHLVAEALKRGHELTLFHRGKSNPNLFPEVEQLFGDRDGNLEALKGREWDAVIDTCGYLPRVVKQTTELLSGKVGNYTFISSISVYENFAKENMTEAEPVGKLDDPTVEEVTGDTYGPLKAICEKEVVKAFGDQALIIRPGLIVGPHDPTDRFTYWVERIAKGGEVLIPDVLEDVTQFIDVRDLSSWIIQLVEKKSAGIYNVTGPQEPLSFKQFFDESKKTLNPHVSYVPATKSFLIGEEVAEWVELPLWISSKEMDGFLKINIDKALETGLTFRGLEETLRDTYQWSVTRPKDLVRRAGLKEERERELILKWKEQQGSKV
ncbi:2'-hydroxyisoflavone reductase [Mesobacillus persicus]|uniref:2'-hydroxyisoflavone reductase n=1 Tax=Mesobacillus persicus TaxID=930146 RepID=A0A1H8DG69_9BACI|nr:NAD-dependent epimerase/dehydratase family protein [Mesobacillus persicus]SEN05794.1 2'-hydroxyisoflavone reductase [Mesobacillus persicus]